MEHRQSTALGWLAGAIVCGVAVIAVLNYAGIPTALAAILGVAVGCGLYALGTGEARPRPYDQERDG